MPTGSSPCSWQGSDKAQVTASFVPPAAGTVLAALLAANEIALEPGEPLLIRRTLKADGGSRAFLNDQPCSAALLREIGGHLVEIHGQHDDRGDRQRRAAQQRSIAVHCGRLHARRHRDRRRRQPRDRVAPLPGRLDLPDRDHPHADARR